MNTPVDPIRAALDQLGEIPSDVVPTGRRRPSKAVVKRMLEHVGRPVTTHDTEVTHDVDGLPTGVARTEQTAVMYTDLESLGWTQAEYDNPNITE